jgi:type I restriction enzyme M protein
MESLHAAILKTEPEAKILEVSTKSENPLGQQLSAFNLTWALNGREYPVECIFQGCKKFSGGGPFRDLIKGRPVDAKHDPRLKESGNLIAFTFRGEDWPLIPTTSFYDFIYISALNSHAELAEAVAGFDTFTDIEFNPKKSLNCQARSAAIFVTLRRKGLVGEYLASREKFMSLYGPRRGAAEGELF